MLPLGQHSVALFSPIVACVIALAGTAVAHAQQFLFGGPQEFELTAPQLDTISGSTQARLEQAQVLAANRQWDEAIEILRDLAAEGERATGNVLADSGGKLVAQDEGTYVSLPSYCQIQLSHLPPEGLAAYRRQVDADAEQRYRVALETRDAAKLEAIVDELFCSSWGDDALLAQGELALEHGDYAAARRAWQAISPLLCDPQGRSTWFALHNLDLSQQWSKIRDRWDNRSTPPNWRAYPDSNFELADVRARLVLASIREGDFERAELELDVFRRLHPQAAGRLGGREGPYAAALEALLKSARDWPATASNRDWPTFARLPTRNSSGTPLGGLDAPQWSNPASLGATPRLVRPQPVAGESAVPLSWQPVIFEDRVFVHDVHSIRALELATGKPAITADGVIFRLDLRTAGKGAIDVEGEFEAAMVASGKPCYTMTVSGGVLYARLGTSVTSSLQPTRARSDERLVGIDLAREGLLTFQVKPDDSSWSFDGAPVGDGRRVYVAMRHSDALPGAYVAAFDAATGRRLWRVFLCAADTPAAGRGGEITNNLLTLAGERLFVNTNLGVVAAIDADDGRVEWLRRYDRAAGRMSLPEPMHFERVPSPCVYHRGMVFVAPADSPQVFALDADNGQTLWVNERLAGATHLLGVAGGSLVVSGRQLWALEARSGRVRFVWPESEHAGVRGFGRGLIAGREAFWPSRERIYVFDIVTGGQTREPIGIAAWTTEGANLVAAGGRLLVVGAERMQLIGPRGKVPPRDEEAETAEKVALNLLGGGWDGPAHTSGIRDTYDGYE